MSTSYRLRGTPESLKTRISEEVKAHKEAKAKLIKLHEAQKATPLTLEKNNGDLLRELASEPVQRLGELGRQVNSLLTESTNEQQNARKEVVGRS